MKIGYRKLNLQLSNTGLEKISFDYKIQTMNQKNINVDSSNQLQIYTNSGFTNLTADG